VSPRLRIVGDARNPRTQLDSQPSAGEEIATMRGVIGNEVVQTRGDLSSHIAEIGGRLEHMPSTWAMLVGIRPRASSAPPCHPFPKHEV
jgi:hypothetical protein